MGSEASEQSEGATDPSTPSAVAPWRRELIGALEQLDLVGLFLKLGNPSTGLEPCQLVVLLSTELRGTRGDMYAMGDPSFRELSEGSRVDIVIHSGDVGQTFAKWHGEACHVQGLAIGPHETWTLYGALYRGGEHASYGLEVDSHTIPFRKPPTDYGAFFRLKELCAGIGGISLGMQATGGCTSVFCDRNEAACAVLRLNEGLVVQGDLFDREVRMQVHASASSRDGLIGAGVPCQGYSRQGNGLGFRDPRSHTLLPVLQTIWHTQSCGAVLECVAELCDSPEAVQVLQCFAHKAGYQLCHVKLDLAAQWASRRVRWWGVLVPASMPPLVLKDWPLQLPSPVVNDIIPDWPVWTPQEENALRWTPLEVAAYGDPAYGTEPRTLDGASKAPPQLWLCLGTLSMWLPSRCLL